MVKLNIDLPEHFLDEEVRDGYTVSSEMKKVWAVELDLLNEFMRVCHKHDIKFFASGGTILGAVRHKGFIPWDDDIDLMMMRSEYERLCKIAQSEFKHPYFFQTEETDPGSYRGHAQLRNSMTTAILSNGFDSNKNINQGIFIDIFPLDYVQNEPDNRKVHYNKLNMLRLKCFGFQERALGKRNISKAYFKQCYDFLWSLFPPICRMISDSFYQKCENLVLSIKDTDCLVLTPIFEERFTWNKSDMDSVIDMPFEMLTIPVPVNYESVLNKTYGKWKEFVVGGSVHGGVIFDTEKPYTHYLSNNQESS